MNSNWKEEAIKLAETGISWREVARTLGKGKSTVSDFLRLHYKGYVKPEDKPVKVKTYKPTISQGETHLIIADTQCKPNVDTSYLECIGKYIVDKKPDVIIHIGDHYDFESLSFYDKGKKSFEGRRLLADIKAGNDGLDFLMKPIKALQDRQKLSGEEVYSPRMVFCLGNHEHRFDRLSDDMPELDGFVGTETLNIEKWGFEVFPFLKPAHIEGISYVHFLANPFTGRPYGGSALNQLKNVGNSFVVGHKQTLDVAIRPTLDGKMQVGIINGACYEHLENYKGYQGNTHFRGITVLHEVEDGFGLPMFVSLDYLRNKYPK